jgi:hypothetical protein
MERIRRLIAWESCEPRTVLAVFGDAQVLDHVIYEEPSMPPIVAVHDLDNDGDPDILVSDTRGIFWYQNDGLGTFDPGQLLYHTDSARRSMAIGDVNGDGKNDIVTPLIGNSNGELMWLENPGNGDPWTPRRFDNGSTWDGLPIVKVVDVDGDEDLDVLAYHVLGALEWCENDGAGGFLCQTVLNRGLGPGYLDTSDINGDGQIDILLSGNGLVTVYTEFVDSIQGVVIQGDNGIRRQFAVAGDVDRDGDDDVFVWTSVYNEFAWYRNEDGKEFHLSQRVSSNSYVRWREPF